MAYKRTRRANVIRKFKKMFLESFSRWQQRLKFHRKTNSTFFDSISEHSVNLLFSLFESNRTIKFSGHSFMRLLVCRYFRTMNFGEFCFRYVNVVRGLSFSAKQTMHRFLKVNGKSKIYFSTSNEINLLLIHFRIFNQFERNREQMSCHS